MKKILLSTLGLVAMAAPALAADLPAAPYRAPPPMVMPFYDWSGFYIGLNGGGGWSQNCWDFIDAIGLIQDEGCHNATGGTAGGQIGYRWQIAGTVFGLEAQGNWANFRGDNTSLFFPTDRNQSRIDAFGLFTGQIGYAWNNALLYVKGGAAVTANKYNLFDIPSGILLDTASETRWGSVVGFGFEYGFAPNWSATTLLTSFSTGKGSLCLRAWAATLSGVS